MMATEKRLKDVSLFEKALEKHRGLVMHNEDILAALANCPTMDAVEVVHGRWEDVQETEMYVPDMKFTITKTAETCSACKARIGFIGAKQYLFDAVCPNCGAKMDGDGNG